MRRTLTVCVALGVLAWSAYSCRSASAAGAFTASGGAIYVPGLGGAEAFDGTIISGPAVIKVPKSDAPGEFTYMMYYDGRIPGGPLESGLPSCVAPPGCRETWRSFFMRLFLPIAAPIRAGLIRVVRD